MLTIDYANCLTSRVGSHGLDPDRLAPEADLTHAATSLTSQLKESRGKGWERWRDLHRDPMRSQHLQAVRGVADRCRDRFDNMLVLGIGGSALGNIALQSALNPLTWNLLPPSKRSGPRLFVLDNVDPDLVGPVLELCGKSEGGLKRTLVNVITKSGETAETAAQFIILRDMLAKAMGDGHKHNLVAVTDPAKGAMRSICDREGYTTLPVPDGVGGRFSVLSPVGLFSAAMCGIDVEGLLDGAATMDEACARSDLRRNPAAMLATLLIELGATKGKTNHVLMPYSNRLYLLADWFRQLWAESLGKVAETETGKAHVGFTPVKALGATDQHSQVQLYRDGPNDKVLGLIEVEEFQSDTIIPSGLGVDTLAYLEGATLGGLLRAEKRATEYALVASQRPNFTIRFPRIDAQHVGQFIYLWEMVTAYAGLMLGIDAYDQPAVETGKQATFGLMGRAGYEEHKQNVDATLKTTEWMIRD